MPDPGPAPRFALMVHGAGGGGWEWGVWARVFAAAGYHVLAPDLVPKSEGLPATNLDDYAAQVSAWMSEIRQRAPAGRLVVVGASLGGLLALMQARGADALVLVNPLPPLPWAARLPGMPPTGDLVHWRRDASLAGTRRAMPDADDATCVQAFRRWRDEAAGVLGEARAGLALARPTCPTRVLASGRDEDVPSALSRELAGWLGADLAMIAGASHVGPLLGRSAAAAAVQTVEWLNALQDRR